MATTNAASRAETAADIALKATGLAKDAAAEAKQHAATLEQHVPNPQKEIIQALAGLEASVLLSVGPKRHRWRDPQAFDEQLRERTAARTAPAGDRRTDGRPAQRASQADFPLAKSSREKLANLHKMRRS